MGDLLTLNAKVGMSIDHPKGSVTTLLSLICEQVVISHMLLIYGDTFGYRLLTSNCIPRHCFFRFHNSTLLYSKNLLTRIILF